MMSFIMFVKFMNRRMYGFLSIVMSGNSYYLTYLSSNNLISKCKFENNWDSLLKIRKRAKVSMKFIALLGHT